MKRILFLGGFQAIADIVKTAKQLGFFTVVVDRDAGSPAKKIADKSYDISTNDIDRLLDICKENQIDGIFNGFEDFNIHVACELSKRLNIRYYATKEQLELMTNKDKFKEQCKAHGISTLEKITLEVAKKEKAFPYIVKPNDSYASRGITICNNEDELLQGYDKARLVSPTKSVIIERFIDSDYGTELFYTVINGNIHLTATADRYVKAYGNNAVPLPTAEIFPSKHSSEIGMVDSNIRKMLTNLQVKNGLILIQMLNKDGEFFPYEMAYRFTGEQHYQLVKPQHGIDLAAMMLKFTAGEDITEYDNKYLDSTNFIYPSANMCIMLKPGKIQEILGLECLDSLEEVKGYIIQHQVGDIVGDNNDYSNMLARINIVAEDDVKLKCIMKHIKKCISVSSDNDEEMVIKD